jgi:hypothetical protein
LAQGITDLSQDKSEEKLAPVPMHSRPYHLFRPATWLGLLILLVLAATGLVAAQQVPVTYTIEVAEAQDTTTLYNFYQKEQNQSGVYRWSEPLSQVRLLPLDSQMRICLDIEEIFPVERSIIMTLDSAGEPKAPFQIHQLQIGRHQYCGETSRLADFLPGDFTTYKDGFLTNIWFGPTLQLKTDSYKPAGDRRELGVLVHSIKVQSAAASGMFGLPTLLEILVTLTITVGSWSVLSTFRLRAGVIFAVALLPLAVWLSLVAFWRVGLADKIEFSLYMAVATLIALFAARFVAPLVLPDLVRALYCIKNGRFPTSTRLQPEQLPSRYRHFSYILGGVTFGLVVLNLVGSYFLTEPEKSGWGFKRFSALPWPLALALVLTAGSLVAISYLNFPLSRAPKTLLSHLPRLNPYWWLLLGGLATSIFFYMVPTPDTYGDSVELIGKLELFLRYRVEAGRDDFLIWREREPLDFALHFLLWRGMLDSGWWKPEYTYALTSVLAGGIFVAVGTLVAANLTRLKAGRWLITGLLLSPATLLVFFGYIESYTFVTLAALVYLWLGLLAVAGKINVAWPALALVIAVMLHPQALFLGPSFVILLLWRAGFFSRKGMNFSLLIREALISGLVTAACVAAFGLLFIMYNYSWQQWGVAQKQFGGSDNGSFKPLLDSVVRPGSRELYPILSWDWLVFQFNLQMRLAPLALPLIGLAGGWLWLHSKPKKGLAGWGLVGVGLLLFVLGLVWLGNQAVIPLVVLGLALQMAGLWLVRHQAIDPAGFFLSSMAGYTWIFSLAWNPDLGSNDWDLLSLNGLFTSLLAGYLVTKALGRFNRFGRTVVAILACAFALQAGWIIYNTYFAIF